MNRIRCAGLAALILLAAPAAQAAQSYDNCTGFIDSLPATISTQGTWCLRKDQATAMTSGAAITIATNNVTIDCNDFKLGGLPAGTDTRTAGIAAPDRFNATVRRCNLRGFYRGIYMTGSTADSSGGHLIEDNRLDNMTHTGILVTGEGSQARRNAVRDTGGSTSVRGTAWGIYAAGNLDIYDNLVSGLIPLADGTGAATSYGMYLGSSRGSRVANNQVRGLTSLGTGNAIGLYVTGSNFVSVRDNLFVGPGGEGIRCSGTSVGARGNDVLDFTTGIVGCVNDGGNVVR